MLSVPVHAFAIKVFDKPLNPILGETYQARGSDGAQIWMEQTCHHPPISHTFITGPDNLYQVTGWSQYNIKAWPNSATVTTIGHKKVKF